MPRGEAKVKIVRSRGDSLAVRCASIPGRMHAARSLAWARSEFEQLEKLATGTGGVLVERRGAAAKRAKVKTGDALANLWFIRAVHEFALASAQWAAAPGQLGGGVTSGNGEGPAVVSEHLEYAAKVLLPVCRRIVQEFISEGMDGVRMADSGMLGPIGKGKPSAALASPLRLNALWYGGLELTGAALRGKYPLGAVHTVKDPSGDHFERLAGRFRREFTKLYWCDEHNRVCPPELREKPDHGALPEAEQLLFAAMPASPLPRTKRREVLEQFQKLAIGVGIPIEDKKHGIVESPLHRAWLAQGYDAAAEGNGDHAAASEIARGLAPLWESGRGDGVHACYKEGKPIGKADPFVTAEVLGTLERFLGSGGRGA